MAGYEIYRDGVLVNTIYGPATSYTDAGLPQPTTYSYQVAAFDAAGNVSPDSATATATTAATPGGPAILAPA